MKFLINLHLTFKAFDSGTNNLSLTSLMIRNYVMNKGNIIITEYILISLSKFIKGTNRFTFKLFRYRIKLIFRSIDLYMYILCRSY